MACVSAVAAATPTHAHLMNTGFGPYYDGLAHPLSAPDDLLPILAIGLLAGLGGARAGRLAIVALPAGWLAGLLVGGLLAAPAAAAWLGAVTTIAVGALVAADRRMPDAGCAAVAGVVGLTHGWQNGASAGPGSAGLTGVLGVLTTVFVAVLLVAGTVTPLQRRWQRIAVRVAGSWITAIGLLMLGWSIRMSRLHS
jgi:hydrogenase/urease accessory protein HupE